MTPYRPPYFSLVGAAALAFILGVFGPSLDQALQDNTAAVQPGEAELIAAEQRRACHLGADDNGSTRVDGHGALICTDKHGRPRHNQITIARKVDAR